MYYIKNFLKGIIIGAGAILPGISSGVLCVAFGIYEKLINSVLGFFTNIKKNTKFLFPIVLGIAIGVIFLGRILKFLYNNYPTPSKLIFAVLILCSLPSIFKKVNTKKIKLRHILILLASLFLSLFLVYLEKYGIVEFNSSNTFVSLFVSGFIMSAGIVVPGISSTIILMLLGKYNIYLSAISNLDFNVLIPIGLGVCLGSLFLLFLIRFLLKKYSDITFFAIIGFVIGSLPVLL